MSAHYVGARALTNNKCSICFDEEMQAQSGFADLMASHFVRNLQIA